jgi:lysophospholipase L1-like esterase
LILQLTMTASGMEPEEAAQDDPNDESPASGDDVMNGEEEEEEEEEDSEDEEGALITPLVSSADMNEFGSPRTTSRSGKRHSLSIANRDEYDDEDATTCWGDTWKCVASVLLTTLLLAPLVHSHVSHHNATVPQENNSSAFDMPSLSSCEDISFDTAPLLEYMKEIGENNGSFCRSDMPSNYRCRCQSPLVAQAKGMGFWEQARQRNIGLITERPVNATSGRIELLDVVFYGDSITEHWMGTDVGVVRRGNAPIQKVFQETFQDKKSSKYQGIALGISGDVCGELLYRLQQGELPDSLNPPVMWILMGANDLGHGCTPGSVLAGIINLVEYLHRARPETTIVINSLLPALAYNKTVFETPLVALSESVNVGLDCYALSSPKSIQFFNATPVFVDKFDHVVGMRDFVHPNGEGSRKWANAIVKRLDQILGRRLF